MLQSLSIKNLALIKNQNIEFDKGLNIIIGETGAGKSLIFEALFFVLGLKTDKSLLRSGEEIMKVDVLFSGLSQEVQQELQSLEIEFEEELLISRSLTSEGKSSIKINGNIATLSSLKSLSKKLVDTLVQHESMQLLNSKNHLLMLDSYIGTKAMKLKQDISEALSNISEINKKIVALGGDEKERERRKEILLYQINEIEKAEIEIGEDDEIDNRLAILNAAEKIKETLSYVNTLLSEDRGVLTRLQDSIRSLNSLSNLDKVINLQERLSNSKYEIEDVFEELYAIYSSSNFDEIEYNRLDSRKDLLKSLKKKYGSSLAAILEYYEKIKNQYDEISNSEFIIEKLMTDKEHIEKKAKQYCDELSRLRKENALTIEEKLVSELRDLGMKGTRFSICFETKAEPTSEGIDNISFEFSANAGQEVKKLSKTASGGEASRIMLALKTIFRVDSNKTLLFDEVDSGISGETANMVANKMRAIANSDQIICITHLPQVAAAGHNFIQVSKEVFDDKTYSNAKSIEESEIINEIARLISGTTFTEASKLSAQELRSKFL